MVTSDLGSTSTMNKFLDITKPESNSFIIWEHLMKSAVAFIGTFAMLFFGPMMLGSSRGGNNSENSLSYQLIEYFIKHPEVQIGLSLLAVVIMNGYIFYKNRKVKYIVKIEQDAPVIRLELTNLYFSRRTQVEILATDFEFTVENSVSENNEKRQKIIFRNKIDNKTIGEIDPKHFLWSEHLVQLKNMIRELDQFRSISTLS